MLPAWSACTVHTPTVCGEIVAPFVPAAVQTVGVVVVNVTANPDDAVADTFSAGWLNIRSGSGPNVIVCGVVRQRGARRPGRERRDDSRQYECDRAENCAVTASQFPT